MAFRYHLSHFRCLSPPTNMIAFRFGSNTNSMRISLLPEDPGLSSFIEGMRLDPFILPTIGRLRSGPCSSNNDTAASIAPAIYGRACSANRLWVPIQLSTHPQIYHIRYVPANRRNSKGIPQKHARTHRQRRRPTPEATWHPAPAPRTTRHDGITGERMGEKTETTLEWTAWETSQCSAARWRTAMASASSSASTTTAPPTTYRRRDCSAST